MTTKLQRSFIHSSVFKKITIRSFKIELNNFEIVDIRLIPVRYHKNAK